jgi:hypothetical protein
MMVLFFTGLKVGLTPKLVVDGAVIHLFGFLNRANNPA